MDGPERQTSVQLIKIKIPKFMQKMKKIMLVQEENILITEDGYELLSTRTPEKLPIIN